MNLIKILKIYNIYIIVFNMRNSILEHWIKDLKVKYFNTCVTVNYKNYLTINFKIYKCVRVNYNYWLSTIFKIIKMN